PLVEAPSLKGRTPVSWLALRPRAHARGLIGMGRRTGDGEYGTQSLRPGHGQPVGPWLRPRVRPVELAIAGGGRHARGPDRTAPADGPGRAVPQLRRGHGRGG